MKIKQKKIFDCWTINRSGSITILYKPPAVTLLAKLIGITDSKIASLVQIFLNSIKL